MTIWGTPPRRLFTAAERIRRNRQEAKGLSPELHEKTIQGVEEDGYVVDGTKVTATGITPGLRIGDRVLVSYKNGLPDVIVSHSARRADFPVVAIVFGGVIEELFIATNPNTNKPDIWFRNSNQVTPLGLSQFLVLTPQGKVDSGNTLRWGLGTDRFLLWNNSALASNPIRVFKLNRTANQAYAPGQGASATLDATYTLSSIAGSPDTVNFQAAPGITGFGFAVPLTALSFGIFDLTYFFHSSNNTWDTSSASSSNTLEVRSNPVDLFLDERGHLIVAYTVNATEAGGTPSVTSLVSTMLVDVTTQLRLMPATLQGTLPALSFTGTNSQLTKVYRMKSGNMTQAVVTETNTRTFGFQTVSAFLGASLQTGVTTGTKLGLFNGGVAFTVFSSLSFRHILWAVVPNSGPSGNQVFLGGLDMVRLTFGSALQIGSTASDVAVFFQSGGVGPDPYRQVRLLNPDFMYDSLNATSIGLVQGLFFVLAWDPANPTHITLGAAVGFATVVNEDTVLQQGAGGLLATLPTLIADYPESPTGPATLEQFMAWQGIDDQNILSGLGRFVSGAT